MTNFNPQDKYFRKAKEQGYRARSVFKLMEIQERFRILKPGQTVLDLGAAPGSFLQYIGQVIGGKGKGIGVDLQAMEAFDQLNLVAYQADIFQDDVYDQILKDQSIRFFDVITSDLAPKTSGIKFIDAHASLELNLRALEIAEKYLKKGGSLVIKALPGFNEGDLIGPTKKLFRQVRKFRPQAVRGSSGEFYLIGLGKFEKLKT